MASGRPQTIPSTIEDTAPMTPNARIPPRVIGCDVGKSTITVFDTATGRTGEIANTAEALLAFARGLPA